jgi:hypothetical protein
MQATAPSYAARSFEIPAGESVQVYRQSNFLTCLEANRAFQVAFDGNSPNDFEKGLTYREDKGFTRVRIINNNPDELSVKLGFGRGQVADNRLVVTDGIKTSAPQNFSTIQYEIPAGDTVSAGSGFGAREFLFANEGDAEVRLLSGQDTRQLANGTVDTGTGWPIEPGSKLVLTVADQIQIKNVGTVQTLVTVLRTAN